MAKSKSQTFVFGALILMVSNILVKVIGAIFKIPLTNTIGVGGMAYFNAAYTIYVSFYMISTAGIPVAVSRMIAESNSKGNVKEVNKIFRLAYIVFFIIGLAGTVIMIAFSKGFANASGMPDAYLAMIAIAPTLFFICLSSAYRGYFQGLQNMIPSAISQVIESAGKLGIGLLAAWFFLKIKGYSLDIVAALVISGVTIGVVAATVYIYVVKLVHNNTAEYKNAVIASADTKTRSTKDLLKELIITSLPIALASSIMGLTNTVDTFVMTRRLVETGITLEAAEKFFGTYTSMVIPLFNMTPTFIYPFAIGVIPVLSAAIASGNKTECKKSMQSAFRMAALIAVPCSIGMGCMSKGVISFLFKNEVIDTGLGSVSTIDLSAPALSVVSCAIFFLGIISITNSILQAYRFERHTIISTTLGILTKIILTYTLSGIENIGVLGSAVGTAGCYFMIAASNIFFVITKAKFVPSISKIFLKPVIAGVLCGLSAIGMNVITSGISGRLSTLVSIGVAVVVYVIVIVAIKGINREDVLMLPKGKKLCMVMDKFGLLEKSCDKE